MSSNLRRGPNSLVLLGERLEALRKMASGLLHGVARRLLEVLRSQHLEAGHEASVVV